MTLVERIVAHLLELEETQPGWDRAASLAKLDRIQHTEGWGWDEPGPDYPRRWTRIEGIYLTSEEIAEVHRRLPVTRADVRVLLDEAEVVRRRHGDLLVVQDPLGHWTTWRAAWRDGLDQLVETINDGRLVAWPERYADVAYHTLCQLVRPWAGLAGHYDGDGEGPAEEIARLRAEAEAVQEA